MKKFRKAKAAEPPPSIEPMPPLLQSFSQPQLSPTIKKSGTTRWRKQKKPMEIKPQFDLAAALPTTDNFRTSLIMPNLSARFSMLREQDDPHSLLGKASDDSVLQPRRKSRMMDYGFGNNGLSDIAEVSSLHGSFRPPFANGRTHSMASEDGYSSGAETPQGVMSRSRPGEGNNLFGGRQKVYKIATSGVTSSRSLGKAVYEDDVGVSAFQKFRQRERELAEGRDGRLPDDSLGFDFGLSQAGGGAEHYGVLDSLHNDSAKDLSHSPSLSSYDKKRSTTSSTGAHSEARSSTAATSVASQPGTSNAPSPAPGQVVSNTPSPAAAPHGMLERSNTKTRRLYEQGLEQNMYEQQSSALSRLNSLHRGRTLNNGKQSPPVLHSTKSASNLHERGPQPVYALRTRSPPPVSPIQPPNTFNLVRKPSSNGASPFGSCPQSPLEAQYDSSNPLTQSIEPADRGKATAMGAFNKPNQSFDEDQYLERQKQLQRSNSSALARNRSAGGRTTNQHRAERLDQDRQRSDSIPSARERSQSGPKSQEPSKAYSAFHNAASQLPTRAQAPAVQPTNRAPLPDTHRTFFGNISASESEDEDDDAHAFHQSDHGHGPHHTKWQPTILPSVSEHPALRGQRSRATLAEEEEELEPRPLKTTTSSRSLRADAPKLTQSEKDEASTADRQVQPLSGMIHHLRMKSTQSSIYPSEDMLPREEIPELPEVPWNVKQSDSYSRVVNGAMESHSKHESTYTGSNPWDLDEGDSALGNRSASRASFSPIESGPGSGSRLNFQSPRQSDFSVADGSAQSNHQGERESSTSSDMNNGDANSWQHELRKQHTREASTATQQERDAFASELAVRRQAIQENMKSLVERQGSRDNSPAPGSSGAFKAFGHLRAKSSRESIANLQNVPPKALRMLGASPSQTNLHSQFQGGVRPAETARPRGHSSPRPPFTNGQHPAFSADTMPAWDRRTASGDGGVDRSQHPAERILASAVNASNRARSRSNSGTTTGRSRSRTGPYRDDLDKAMDMGVGSSAAGHPELSPMIPREYTPRPSPDVGSGAFGIATDDTNGSRVAMSNYFDQKNLIPIQTATGANGRSTPGGPSPIAPSPNAYNAARPGPVANQYPQNTTPPISGTSTPVTAAVSPALPANPIRPNGMLRKKTISKSDISEPTLISSTSNIDTVNLPEGASLKNGMDEAPPIPPINPKRRGGRKLFGMGSRGGSNEEIPFRGKSADFAMPSSTNGTRTPQRVDMEQSSPPFGFPSGTSPERVERSSPPRHNVGLDGGMF